MDPQAKQSHLPSHEAEEKEHSREEGMQAALFQLPLLCLPLAPSLVEVPLVPGQKDARGTGEMLAVSGLIAKCGEEKERDVSPGMPVCHLSLAVKFFCTSCCLT